MIKFSVQAILTSLLAIAFYLPLSAQDYEMILPEKREVHEKDISQLSPLEILEDSLVYFADSMYNSPIPDFRVAGSYEFIRIFKTVLKTPNSYNYPFKKLSEKISILRSPDDAFRIYNWEVVRGTVEHRYYGVMQLTDGSFIPLVDVSDQIIRGAEDSIFNGTRWYGSLYYNILLRQIDDQKIYFLIGWNGSSMNSEKKIIEAFGFNSQGQGMFGAPVFNMTERGKRRKVNRVVIEYQKGSRLSMNYDKETDQIIFDHCESQIGDPAKRYTYIPDGTYDGFKWDGHQWTMYENVVQITDTPAGSPPLDKPIK
ncbi:MAG: hypothetical protein JNJ58_04005 [Chitinophagaceae bacterium]|nr:hypothetical protein [Chitinophagaceae bacterium]